MLLLFLLLSSLPISSLLFLLWAVVTPWRIPGWSPYVSDGMTTSWPKSWLTMTEKLRWHVIHSICHVVFVSCIAVVWGIMMSMQYARWNTPPQTSICHKNDVLKMSFLFRGWCSMIFRFHVNFAGLASTSHALLDSHTRLHTNRQPRTPNTQKDLEHEVPAGDTHMVKILGVETNTPLQK